MSTLLLRLAAPMQAWGGANSRFNHRMTEREPTKSGVIGMVSAALGRRRTESIEDLCCLRFGVRIDQPGSLLRDFHTVHTQDRKQSYVTERYYLADAAFLAGLEGDETLLRCIDSALKNPVFPLFLGRRSCPPTGRLSLGIRNLDLDSALQAEPWLASEWYRLRYSGAPHLEIVRDARTWEDAVFVSNDSPLSFNSVHRRYALRGTVRVVAAHDPFAELEEP